MIGYKHLRADGSSLNGKFKYLLPVDGAPGPWQDVPGNGAYIAVTDGLFAGGDDPQGMLVRMEGDEQKPGPPSEVKGVLCSRRVRLLAVAFSAGDSLPALTADLGPGVQWWLAERLPVEQLPALTAAFSPGVQWWLAERLPVEQLPALTAAFSPGAQWLLAERLPVEQLPALTAAFSPDAQRWLAERLPEVAKPAGGEP